MQRVQQMANKAMKDYAMLTDGDRIMIGLSGGKDSLALVEVLAVRQRIFKPKIEVLACHVSVENVPYQSDLDYLREFCESRGVKFVHKTTSFDEDTKDGRGPCFLCAWNRRKTLFKAAEELGCQKLALGHHKDDILETLLMNQIFQGAYATMPPVLKMAKFDMTIIHPLALVREAEIEALAVEHEYRKQIKNCPHEKAGNRPQVREILQRMEELNPNAASSLWGAMSNIQEEYLPKQIIMKNQ
jgi:tRNA(Ile)-lysidine synthase TilS/MesJ